MRICIVGGTGNISISIVRRLLELGHDVTCFNRGKSPGLPDGARGLEVELVGVPFDVLARIDIPNFGICRDIFAHHLYYSAEKLFRDVPEYQPRVSLEEGMRQVLEAMDREGRVPNSDAQEWEDRIIAAQRRVGAQAPA
ncbi:MAG: hypothetical protein ACREIT_00090 [Tepidisphaeraceae bacterium]